MGDPRASGGSVCLGVPGPERIATLRKRCRERKGLVSPDTVLVDYRSLRGSERLESRAVRTGLRTRDRLLDYRFDLDDLELLVGRPASRPIDTHSEEYRKAREYLSRLPGSATPGQSGHCELDRRIVFENGIDGALRLLADKERREQDPFRKDTYRSFLHALEGLQGYVENAAKAAEDAVRGADERRQRELVEMARVCRSCAHHPPGTFREALQLMWFVDAAVAYADNASLVSPGHIDRTLYPYYARDTGRAALGEADALLLLESYYVLINDCVPDGLAVAVMVGGLDAAGRDLTNDLSYLCLEALRRTNLVYPTVGVCWHERTPERLVELAVELVSQGYTTPAFFGDETIQRGLRRYGVPASESWSYVNSTCVEITPVGSSNVWVASPYFPVCRYLLEEIESVAGGGVEPRGFDGFLRACLRRIGGAIEQAVREQNAWRTERQRHGGKPLQSVFTDDCVERGLDIDSGGARYNWIECSFVGLANLVDSLHVVRTEIFGTRKTTFAEMDRMLKADFVGYELERSRFLCSHEKYGHDAAPVDSLMGTVVDYLTSECARHAVFPGGTHFVPGAFCWIMHEQLGRQCGATPDGRRAGKPFADGCGPAQGREAHGPTAAILSTTSWDHSSLIGGAAYNMRFGKGLVRDRKGRGCLRDLVVTFLKRGGFEVQINVADTETLRKAKASPEEYRDLVVRIGGYTDYFVRLSPEMQEEIMSRAEFAGP